MYALGLLLKLLYVSEHNSRISLKMTERRPLLSWRVLEFYFENHAYTISVNTVGCEKMLIKDTFYKMR